MRPGLIHINMGPMSSPDGPARTIEAGTAAVAGLP